jgi:hypothetical protein
MIIRLEKNVTGQKFTIFLFFYFYFLEYGTKLRRTQEKVLLKELQRDLRFNIPLLQNQGMCHHGCQQK